MILPSKGEGNQNARLRQAARPRGGGGEKKGQLDSLIEGSESGEQHVTVRGWYDNSLHGLYPVTS